MEDTNTTYRMPEGFNPYSSVDAVRGLADAIHWMHFDGPASGETMALGDKMGLDALVDLLRSQAHDLHDYLHELANSTSLHLPMNDVELEALRWKGTNMVRETAAIYSIR